MYEQVLCTTVDALGSDSKRVCPSQLIAEHVQLFGKIMCVTIPISIDTILTDDPAGYGTTDIQDEYRTRIIDFADDLIKYGYV